MRQPSSSKPCVMNRNSGSRPDRLTPYRLNEEITSYRRPISALRGRADSTANESTKFTPIADLGDSAGTFRSVCHAGLHEARASSAPSDRAVRHPPGHEKEETDGRTLLSRGFFYALDGEFNEPLNFCPSIGVCGILHNEHR